MLNKLKVVIAKMNENLDAIEKSKSKVSKSIKLFKSNMEVIEGINSITLENHKLNDALIVTSLNFNKDKIKEIEKHIKTARQNILNAAEIHSFLSQLKDESEYKLVDIDFESEDLEKEVEKLIKPLSKKTDKELAAYIRDALNYIKDKAKEAKE